MLKIETKLWNYFSWFDQPVTHFGRSFFQLNLNMYKQLRSSFAIFRAGRHYTLTRYDLHLTATII